MKQPLLFELSAAQGLGAALAHHLPAEIGKLDRRQFPDGETYLRFETPVIGRDVILLCTLDRPDPKLAPMLFAAAAVRAQGATRVGLVAPYLAYMRQDEEFRPGEAITSRAFARVLSDHVDWLVTVDPHVHRYRALDSIYSVSAIAATAAGPIAQWIGSNVDNPVIIGPDEESRQWVERIANLANAQFAILKKERGGDYSVTIDGEGLEQLERGTPVLVDDIAASATTLIEAVRLIKRHRHEAPVCAVVHAVFAADSYNRLLDSGVTQVVSTNSVAHASNMIDISKPLAAAISASAARLGRQA